MVLAGLRLRTLVTLVRRILVSEPSPSDNRELASQKLRNSEHANPHQLPRFELCSHARSVPVLTAAINPKLRLNSEPKS
jgi:hypothetical protein